MLTTVGLIGDPVAHSISPAMHNAAFAAYGIPEEYVLWPTPAANLPERVTLLRSDKMRGANVTLPHKSAVMPLIDTVDHVAQAIGAVNTIVRTSGGGLHGLNTDAPGFIRALQSAEYQVQGGRAVLLGSGGAARAVAYALIQDGVRSLVIANRTIDHAVALLKNLECVVDTMPSTHIVGLDDQELSKQIEHADLLVNATSAGLDGRTLPLDPEHIHAGLLVVDLIYHQTPFLSAATDRGAVTQDGLEMLVQQGAIAFEAWTNHAAPTDIMRQAAKKALEKHS